MVFNVRIIKGDLFAIVYNIWVIFGFLLKCHSYNIQKYLDDITNENNKEHNEKMPMYSRSSLQNFDNWRLWIRQNKCIILFDNSARWHWWGLFVCKRFKGTKISVFDLKPWKCRKKTFKWSESIYWVFK